MVLFGGCGGSSSSRGETPAPAEPDSTSIDQVAVERHSDPTQPVGVVIGQRFELLLPADPTRGWRWVLEPFDTTVVVALASTFVDDPALLNSTSTTTTVPTTVPGAGTGSGTAEPTVTWIPTTTTTIDPDSPEAAPLVQIITFAGRSLATTAIKLRYEPIGDNTANPRTVTFTVVVYAQQS
jgi:hypothetical protein